MTKQNVITAMKTMPQEFHLDQLFEKLVFIEKVNEGIKAVEQGKVISHIEMKKRILEWRR